jgi:hypothetical protein
MKLNIAVKFLNGKTYSETFSTGLYTSQYCYDEIALCEIDRILKDELTVASHPKFEKLVNQDWWKEAVNKHDNELIESKMQMINDLKNKLKEFNEVK